MTEIRHVNNVNDVANETMNVKEKMTMNENSENCTKPLPPMMTEEELVKSTKLQLHPYCSIFPVASASEIEALAEDIRRNGLQDKITTYQKKILDGRNRYLGCLRANIEPKYVEFDGDTSADGLLQFVMSKNASRRHLTTSQRALIAARMSAKSNEAEQNGENITPQICGFTQVKAAGLLVVSERQVQSAAMLLREASQKLIGEIERGEKTIHEALRQRKTTTPEPPIHTALATDIEQKDSKIDMPEQVDAENVTADEVIPDSAVIPFDFGKDSTPEKSSKDQIDDIFDRISNTLDGMTMKEGKDFIRGLFKCLGRIQIYINGQALRNTNNAIIVKDQFEKAMQK